MKIDGLPVVNATKPVIIEITSDDVKKGNTKDPGSCAAALACRRQLGVTQARVHLGRTYVKDGKKWRRFQTPLSMRSEIVAFDRGGTFEPGIYKLLPVSEQQRPDGKAKGGKTNKTNTNRDRNKKKRHYHVTTGVRSHGATR